jgi:transposase
MRTYKPVKPKSPRDARMRRAARLRGEGKSLRQIAAEQEVSYETVRRDLARWDELNAPDASVSHLPVTKTPPRGGNVTAECDSEDAAVIPLRRLA